MTQLELAEKLNYSDKAVSKWEHADSMPDIAVLVEIAELFSVPLDYLVRAEHTEEENTPKAAPVPKYRTSVIAIISIFLVWFIAVAVYVMISSIKGTLLGAQNLCFVYAIPAMSIVWLVLNSIWFNRRRNYLIISVLMWSVLASVHLSILAFSLNVWMIYLLGIPGQIIILLWSLIKRKPK